jgi:hypothetical protein
LSTNQAADWIRNWYYHHPDAQKSYLDAECGKIHPSWCWMPWERYESTGTLKIPKPPSTGKSFATLGEIFFFVYGGEILGPAGRVVARFLRIGSRAAEEGAAASPAAVKPPGISTNAWGNKVWGQGPDDALSRIGTRSADELRELGLDVDKATKLRNFYSQAAAAGKGGATAPARVKLMNDIIRTLKGS